MERERAQRELLKKQLEEGKIKRQIEEPSKQEEQRNFQGKMPTYYQPGIIPQEMKPDVKECQKMFIEKLINPFTSLEELRDMFMKPVPPNVG